MKVFQILGGFCHWDATEVVPTLADAAGRFSSDMVFAEAPDYVYEGWGFDATAVGEGRFLRPVPPEGWIYDEATGTFYPEGGLPHGGGEDVWDALAAAYAEGVNIA